MAVFTLSNVEYLKNTLKAFRVAFIIYAGIRILEELKQDQFSLARLLTGLASDLIQALIASFVGIAAGAAAGSLLVFAGLVAPVAVIFIITVGVSLGMGAALMHLDDRFEVTKKLIEYAKKIEERRDSDYKNQYDVNINAVDSITRKYEFLNVFLTGANHFKY